MYTIVVWPHKLLKGHLSFSYGTSPDLGLRRASLYIPLAISEADKCQRGEAWFEMAGHTAATC